MADSKYLSSGNVKMNFCTSQNGKFDYCVETKTLNPTPLPTPLPSRRPTPSPQPEIASYNEGLTKGDEDGGGESEDEDRGGGGGLPGWAIGIIAIITLMVICCIVYCVLVSCFSKKNSIQATHNNIYTNERNQDTFSHGGSRGQGGSLYGKSVKSVGRRDINLYFEDEKSQGRESRSRRTRHTNGIDDVQIILSEPQDPKFEDDYFTINTYGTRPNRKSRDPTMYIPGQERLPDPDNDVFMIQDGGGSARYKEDPPLKPKRDPTMYFDGGCDVSENPSFKPKRDPTMYVDDQDPKRDPTMYIDDQDPSVYMDGKQDRSMAGRESAYSIDPFGRGDLNDEYDQFGFRSEEKNEYEYAGRDPTYYSSYQTREAGKSAGVESHINVSYYEDDESFRTKEAKSNRKSNKMATQHQQYK